MSLLTDLLLVSFKILDLKGDNKLDEEELKSMLQACVQENNIRMQEDHVNMVLAKTFEEVDMNQDGFIDMDEYKYVCSPWH